MNKRLLIFFLLFAAGCVSTVEDFQSMSSSKRAEKICYGSDEFKSRKSDIKETSELIEMAAEVAEEKSVLLNRGYRIHVQCEETWPARRGCKETPVAIDSTYEAKELDKLMSTFSNLKDELKTRTGWQESMTSVCMRLAVQLNSREAYTHYIRHTEP